MHRTTRKSEREQIQEPGRELSPLEGTVPRGRCGKGGLKSQGRGGCRVGMVPFKGGNSDGERNKVR